MENSPFYVPTKKKKGAAGIGLKFNQNIDLDNFEK